MGEPSRPEGTKQPERRSDVSRHGGFPIATTLGKLDLQHLVPSGDQLETRTARILSAPARMEFDECPICFAPDPAHKEHVPPRGIGGTTWLTKTCKACNNTLGSRLESHLSRWANHELHAARFRAETVRGARTVRSAVLRQTPDGRPAIVIDAPSAGDIDTILRSARLTLSWLGPSNRAVRLALLKHTYLTWCLINETIPVGDAANHIRRELLAAQSPAANGPAHTTTMSESLTPWRLVDAPQLPPAVYVQFSGGQTAFIFGARVMVTGPFGVRRIIRAVEPVPPPGFRPSRPTSRPEPPPAGGRAT